ncbi:MAG: methyltransferase domain-containing protein [Promethearchaeota archaeon]
MSNIEKWKIAAEAEKEFWFQEDVKAIKTGIHWRKFLKDNFQIDFGFFGGKSVMEVGCGPYGIIHFIDPIRPPLKIGIDPLDFCKIWERFKIKTPHIMAAGEKLPFRDQSIDIVICFNVLDHVIFPKKVVAEISRVLKKNGRLLLWLHTVKSFIKPIEVIFGLFDRIHPHHFYPTEVVKLLRKEGLRPILISNKRFKEGSIMRAFVTSLLYDDFKVATGNFFINNMFMVLRK